MTIYGTSGSYAQEYAETNHISFVSEIPNVKKWVITYNANGGKNAPNPQTKAKDKAITLSKVKPTRKGYTFQGWATSKTSTKVAYAAGASFSKNENTTLYAVWKANTYKISFNPNGGTGKSMATMSCTYAKSYTLKANTFTRTGYTFTGWNTKADGTGTYSYANKATVKNVSSVNGKTIKLYAQWSPTTYKITYVLNGGKNSTKNPSSYQATTSTITLQTPTKKGYTFVGWYTNSSYKTKVTKITKGSTGNKTFYAKWRVNSYTIRYNGNGATSGEMFDTTSCQYGKTYTLTKNSFKKTGYTFKGWAKSSKGALRYKNAEKVTSLSSVDKKVVNLYAVWEKK